MSLVRNLTQRARALTRGDEVQALPRSCTVKYTPGTISRAKISLPTELLSTTNVQVHNAPSINKHSTGSFTSSSADSVNSDSDFSSIDKSFLSADTSSLADLSPITPVTPFMDSQSGGEKLDFFSSKPVIVSAASSPAESVPAIPTRAPSHSKRAHLKMSREMSVKRSMSPPPTDITAPTARDATVSFSSPKASVLEASHPFGQELAKVAEVAESFGSSGMVLDEEEQEMMTKGLQKFSVDDYLAEITGLTGGIYEDKITLNPWL